MNSAISLLSKKYSELKMAKPTRDALIKFKLKNVIIYIHDPNSNTDYVCERHFQLYLQKREQVPQMVRIFDHVSERNAILDSFWDELF